MSEDSPPYGAGPFVEEYLDCTGKKRRFRLGLYAGDRFLEAVEMRGGEALGLRVVLPVRAGEEPPWGDLRDLIREHLSRKDVVRDGNGELQLLSRKLRAQIRDTGEYGPLLLVDDLELTWEDLGRLLESYTGWNLRLEIRDPSEG